MYPLYSKVLLSKHIVNVAYWSALHTLKSKGPVTFAIY